MSEVGCTVSLKPSVSGTRVMRLRRACELGVEDKYIHLDHGLTGHNRTQPDLPRALAVVWENDTLVAATLDWLGPVGP